MLPEGWTRRTVGEMGIVHAGRQRSPGFSVGQSRPYLRVANVFDGWIDLSDVYTMPFTDEEFSRYKLVPGDILLNEGQSWELVGRPAMFSGPKDTYCFQNTLVRFTASKYVLPQFALLKFQQCLYDGTFQSIAKKTTSIAHLGVSRFAELELMWPPINEQKKIVERLETWTQAVAASKNLLANSRKQKQALMQELLFTTTDESERLPLSAIAERVQRVSNRAEHPVLMISSGTGFVRQDQKYSRFMAGKSLDNYILLKRGEFAYNKGNSKLYEFGCVFPLEDYETGLVPHVYVCFKLSDRCHADFFKYLFEADYLHDQLGAMVNTGVRNNGLLNIRPADFMSVKVPVPSMERQRYIASVLSAASEEIKILQMDLEALRTQKRVLMADLLTGKRRVHTQDPTAEPKAA